MTATAAAITAQDRADNPRYIERDGFLYPPVDSEYQYGTDPATVVDRIRVGDVIRYSVTVPQYPLWAVSPMIEKVKVSEVRTIHRDAYGLYYGTVERIDEDTAWEDQASTGVHRIEIVVRHEVGAVLVYAGTGEEDLRGTTWTWAGPCGCGHGCGRGKARNERWELSCVSAASMVTADMWREGRTW